MRARQVLKILYELFWVFLALLPMLFWLFGLWGGIDPQGIDEAISANFALYQGYACNIVEWLATNTGLGIDETATIWRYIDYFIVVEIMHFIVDIFLWVFRFARKILDSWGVKE